MKVSKVYPLRRSPDCYIIGILKAIRRKPGKRNGDTIRVVIVPAEADGESPAKRSS